MRKSFSTCYIPYLLAMGLMAACVTTAVVLLSRTDFFVRWVWDLIATVSILFSLWCLAEIAISIFTFLKIDGSRIIFTKTIFSKRIEFDASSVTIISFCGKDGLPVKHAKKYKNLKIVFSIGSNRTESILFPAITDRRLGMIKDALIKSGIDGSIFSTLE